VAATASWSTRRSSRLRATTSPFTTRTRYRSSRTPSAPSLAIADSPGSSSDVYCVKVVYGIGTRTSRMRKSIDE
jgi:hypothetical protein